MAKDTEQFQAFEEWNDKVKNLVQQIAGAQKEMIQSWKNQNMAALQTANKNFMDNASKVVQLFNQAPLVTDVQDLALAKSVNHYLDRLEKYHTEMVKLQNEVVNSSQQFSQQMLQSFQKGVGEFVKFQQNLMLSYGAKRKSDADLANDFAKARKNSG